MNEGRQAMDVLTKLICVFILMAASFFIGIWSLVSGYGVTIQSWPVIVTAFFGQLIVFALLQGLSKKSD
jgi:hypothetical protein